MPEVDIQPCAEFLEEHGFLPACPGTICEDFRFGWDERWHLLCQDGRQQPIQAIGCVNKATNEGRWWGPHEIFDRCNELHAKDPNWSIRACYCCCIGFPEVATPDGETAASDVVEGDEVQGGSGSGPQLAWAPVRVGFSEGVEVEREPIVALEYAGRRIALPPEQVLMLADGALARADDLAAGRHLLGADGGAIELTAVESGQYSGPMHRIATDAPWTGSPDGHLLALGGLVAGDYALTLRHGQAAA